MDPITLIIGAGLIALGWVGGRFRRPGPPTPRAICGCGHALAMHDRNTDQCHSQKARDKYGPTGAHIGSEWVSCTCRRYTGPQPLDEFLAPTYLPPKEQP